MNNDGKILKILTGLQADITTIKDVQEKQGNDIAALKSDMTAVKSETAKIPSMGERLERSGKLLTGLGASIATVLEEQHAQRSDIRSLLTDIGTLHEEFHTSHEELIGEIRAARAEAKMDSIDLKSTVAKKSRAMSEGLPTSKRG